MKTYILLINIDKRLFICGNENSALQWEISKGKTPIGKIETELNFLELKEILRSKENGEK